VGLIYAKNALAAGAPPGPRWGAHDIPPDPLVGWRGGHPASPHSPLLGALGASILAPSALRSSCPRCFTAGYGPAYGLKIWTDLSTILSQITDRQNFHCQTASAFHAARKNCCYDDAL